MTSHRTALKFWACALPLASTIIFMNEIVVLIFVVITAVYAT